MHLAVEVGTKFDQGGHHTTARVETLQKVGGADRDASPRGDAKARRSRPRMTDVGGAVKAVQD